MRTAQLAIHYRNVKEYHIVGVDLSGNPTVCIAIKENSWYRQLHSNSSANLLQC